MFGTLILGPRPPSPFLFKYIPLEGGGGGACAWEAATPQGMAWPANPGCQGNPYGIRWGVSPTAQTGCQRARGWCPPGADQPGGRRRGGGGGSPHGRRHPTPTPTLAPPPPCAPALTALVCPTGRDPNINTNTQCPTIQGIRPWSPTQQPGVRAQENRHCHKNREGPPQGGNVSAPGARRASFVTCAPPVDCCR